jgi:hypothetical protein
MWGLTNCVGNFTVGEERKYGMVNADIPPPPPNYFTSVFLPIILFFFFFFRLTTLDGFSTYPPNARPICPSPPQFFTPNTLNFLQDFIPPYILGRPLDLFPTGLHSKSSLPFSTPPSYINSPNVSILIIISMCVFQV